MNWKKIFTALAIGAVTLLLVFVGGGMLLDPEFELETESTLDAPPEALYVLIADPAGVIRWWQGAGQEMGIEAMADMVVIRGEGPATGPGATVLFEIGGKVAEEWTLISANPRTEAVWDVDFQVFVTRRTVQLQALPDGKTRVRWHEIATFENPLTRWFTLLPSDAVIENFQGALRLLEKRARAQ